MLTLNCFAGLPYKVAYNLRNAQLQVCALGRGGIPTDCDGNRNFQDDNYHKLNPTFSSVLKLIRSAPPPYLIHYTPIEMPSCINLMNTCLALKAQPKGSFLWKVFPGPTWHIWAKTDLFFLHPSIPPTNCSHHTDILFAYLFTCLAPLSDCKLFEDRNSSYPSLYKCFLM